MAKTNTHMEVKARAVWETPKVEDLVMIRDMKRDKAHGRKLKARWLSPRLLVEIFSSGVSAYVKDLYNDQVKRYHLNDLKVYCSRESDVLVPRNAMALADFPGQRAFDLGYI
jgi:hypothetical protein